MTISEKLKKAFDPYFTVPLEIWHSFAELCEIITIEKEQILKKYDTTENYFYFILSGSGGIFLWNNSNYICVDLCFENEFFGDYMSFLTEQNTALEVITFEKSELLRISRNNFNNLSNNNILGNNICRIAAEGLFVHKQQQQIEILSKTAKERYINLLNQNPNIIQKTPQKYIASYLGITPQSLSRIRNEISKL